MYRYCYLYVCLVNILIGIWRMVLQSRYFTIYLLILFIEIGGQRHALQGAGCIFKIRCQVPCGEGGQNDRPSTLNAVTEARLLLYKVLWGCLMVR